MKFKILTLFPDFLKNYMKVGIIGRAVKEHKINVDIVDFRDYSQQKHRKVDDSPYGGGSGMLLCCDPLYRAIMDLKSQNSKIVFLSPSGIPLNQAKASKLSQEREILMVCGFYEGFDARLFKLFPHEKLSIGDYVLTNGGLASLVVLDVISRLCEGVLGNVSSIFEESFEDSLLEYDQYTKPADYRGLRVPEELVSGDHARIKEYRRRSSLRNTYRDRPDLFLNYRASMNDLEFLIS